MSYPSCDVLSYATCDVMSYATCDVMFYATCVLQEGESVHAYLSRVTDEGTLYFRIHGAGMETFNRLMADLQTAMTQVGISCLSVSARYESFICNNLI